MRAGRLGDGVRLALGTLTVVPVPAPRTVDRAAGGVAMVLAPLVGALLGATVAAGLWTLDRFTDTAPLLPAALAVAALALLTRGMHLDGLADTADGLGSGRDAAGALAVMRRGDVGPFGVVTLLLVLLVQAAALAELVASGHGAGGLVVAVTVGRLALPVLCRSSVPAARPDGLGAVVAGSVGATGLATSVVLTTAVVVTAGRPVLPAAVAATLAGVLVVLLLQRRAVRRLGGVTGDVLGAGVEVATTTALVVLALG